MPIVATFQNMKLQLALSSVWPDLTKFNPIEKFQKFLGNFVRVHVELVQI